MIHPIFFGVAAVLAVLNLFVGAAALWWIVGILAITPVLIDIVWMLILLCILDAFGEVRGRL